MHHQSLFVEALAGLRTVFAEIQFAINIIFNQRDIMLSNDVHQRFFPFIGHQAAERIAEIGNEHTCLHREFIDHFAKTIEIRPRNGVGQNFHNFQPDALNGLVQAEISRLFHRYRIAVFGNRAQAMTSASMQPEVMITSSGLICRPS